MNESIAIPVAQLDKMPERGIIKALMAIDPEHATYLSDEAAREIRDNRNMFRVEEFTGQLNNTRPNDPNDPVRIHVAIRPSKIYRFRISDGFLSQHVPYVVLYCYLAEIKRNKVMKRFNAKQAIQLLELSCI